MFVEMPRIGKSTLLLLQHRPWRRSLAAFSVAILGASLANAASAQESDSFCLVDAPSSDMETPRASGRAAGRSGPDGDVKDRGHLGDREVEVLVLHDDSAAVDVEPIKLVYDPVAFGDLGRRGGRDEATEHRRSATGLGDRVE